jgi:hypothetical protein
MRKAKKAGRPKSSSGERKYKRIQEQFKILMNERTPSGAKPSSTSVVEQLAENWCLSEKRIRIILTMQLA